MPRQCVADWIDAIARWTLGISAAIILLAGIAVSSVLLALLFGVWSLLALIPFSAAVWMTIRDC